jgi:tetratricopeptide (TPR) repeat protein
MATLMAVLALGMRPAVAEPIGGQAQVQTQDTDGTLLAANKLLEKKRYVEALAQYKIVLVARPNDPATLWNAGIAASMAKDYTTALPIWLHLKTLDPRNGEIRARLVQVYQATGDHKARAEARRSLVALRKSGKDSDLEKGPSFCCDLFTANGRTVSAYDYFTLTGQFARRYDFLVLQPDGTTDYRITLESDQLDTDMAREMHSIKPNERLFTLDGYYDQGSLHKTFGFYKNEISYDEAKAAVLRVLGGKKTAVSSTARPNR